MRANEFLEGKSPHKKGTKKYKKHMAAKHASMGETATAGATSAAGFLLERPKWRAVVEGSGGQFLLCERMSQQWQFALGGRCWYASFVLCK